MENTKSRWKKILVVAWPLILANSFWNLQLTIDRIFLGALSTEALGAAMAVMGVFWVPMALLQQTSGYVITFVAQYFGAKESHKIGACIWQAVYVSITGGILFLGLNLLSGWFFSLIGHSPSIQKFEVEYFNAVAFSALPTALVAAFSGFFTGLGNTKVVLQINFVGLVLNAVLDYAMIFGNWGFPALGVAGAGYATAIATFGSAIYGAYVVFNHKNDQIYHVLRNWKPDFTLVKQFLKFGIPSGMQWAFEGLAFTVFLIVIGYYPKGEAALASSSIAVTILMLAVLPSMGVAQSVMTLVGQYLGEKNPAAAEQVTRDGIKISQVYMVIIALTFVTFPEFYISWFKNEENMALWSDVNTLAAQLLMIVAVFTLLDSVYLNISFALKGAGDTRFISMVALFVPWPLMVLPAFLVKGFENPVIWAWCFCAFYSFTTVIIVYLRFKHGRWKTMSVIS